MSQMSFLDVDITDLSSIVDALTSGNMLTIIFAVFLGMLILMIFFLIYNYFIKGPKKKAEANRRRDVALSALQGTNYGY